MQNYCCVLLIYPLSSIFISKIVFRQDLNIFAFRKTFVIKELLLNRNFSFLKGTWTFKNTVMQIKKALIKDSLRVSKVS